MRNYVCYPEQRCHRKNNSSLCLLVIFLSCILCLIPCTLCHAGLAVSVTTGDDWAIGTTGMGVTTETSGDTWVATGSSDTLETVYIKADGTTWSPGSAAGEDTFILKHKTSASWSNPITNTGNGIALAYMEIAGTEGFDLQFIAPTSTTVGGEHSLTVTLTAVAWDETVTDIDANSYTTVVIGTQRWLGENMRTTKYPDGSAITDGTALTTEWATDVAMYSCPPNVTNDGSDCAAASTLGMSYQWSAAMNGSTTAGAQGICPNGWHIPTDVEQHTLDDLYDSGTCDPARVTWGCDPAGTALNEAGSSGFEGLLAGYRYPNSALLYRGTGAGFWSSLQSGTNAWWRSLYLTNSTVYRNAITKAYGFSVRCIKD